MSGITIKKTVGATGVILILFAYYLLWISPDTELEEVIFRTRAAITMNLFGAVMIMYYMYKR